MHCGVCLAGVAGLFPAVLVPIIAGCVLLVGSSADMVLPPDLLKVSGPQVLGSSVILFGCPAVSEDGLIAG